MIEMQGRLRIKPFTKSSTIPLVTAYQEKQKVLQEATLSLEEQKNRSISLDGFIQELKQQDSLITNFNQELWQTSVERFDIKADKKISLTFKNGVKIDL